MKMIILWGVLGCVFSQMYQKVKLKDVDVLTLYQGKMTNGRRSAPVPQLQVSFRIPRTTTLKV